MKPVSAPIPHIVLAYGILGIIPFWLPSFIGMVDTHWHDRAAFSLAAYAGLILSFLGGARWGQEVRRSQPDPLTISLAMLPSLAALAALVLPVQRPVTLLLLATGLALHWLWDVGSPNLPGWYPRLRTILTVGAVSGLMAGALLF